MAQSKIPSISKTTWPQRSRQIQTILILPLHSHWYQHVLWFPVLLFPNATAGGEKQHWVTWRGEYSAAGQCSYPKMIVSCVHLGGDNSQEHQKAPWSAGFQNIQAGGALPKEMGTVGCCTYSSCCLPVASVFWIHLTQGFGWRQVFLLAFPKRGNKLP